MKTTNTTDRRPTTRLLAIAITLLALLGSNAIAQTTVRWLAGEWGAERARTLIAQFEAENPDIRIEADFAPWDGLEQRMLVSLRGSNPPDLVDVTNTWNISFAGLGLLQALDPYLWDGFDPDIFYETNWATTQYDGQTFGLPFRTDVLALVYNRDLLADAGLPDRAPDTWEELLEFAQALTRDTTGDGQTDVYGWGSVGSNTSNVIFRVLPLIWQNGGQVLDADNSRSLLHEAPAVEAVQFYADLFAVHGVAPASTMSNNAQEVDRLFINERVAINMTGPWIVPQLRDQAPDLDFATAPMVGRGDDRTVVMGGWNIALSRGARNPEAAARFLEFFVRPENVAYYTETLPAVRAASEAERFQDPALQGFIAQLEHTRMLPLIPQWTQVQQVIFEEVQQVMFERKTAQQAMQDATDQIDQILAR
jgi:multiple sugar transport system substrate-binding protein